MSMASSGESLAVERLLTLIESLLDSASYLLLGAFGFTVYVCILNCELRMRQRDFAREVADLNLEKMQYHRQKTEDEQELQTELDERLGDLARERDEFDLAKGTHDADVREQETQLAEARAELAAERKELARCQADFDLKKQAQDGEMKDRQTRLDQIRVELEASVGDLARRQEQFGQDIDEKIKEIKRSQKTLWEEPPSHIVAE